jgi:hypothetical protein
VTTWSLATTNTRLFTPTLSCINFLSKLWTILSTWCTVRLYAFKWNRSWRSMLLIWIQSFLSITPKILVEVENTIKIFTTFYRLIITSKLKLLTTSKLQVLITTSNVQWIYEPERLILLETKRNENAFKISQPWNFSVKLTVKIAVSLRPAISFLSIFTMKLRSTRIFITMIMYPLISLFRDSVNSLLPASEFLLWIVKLMLTTLTPNHILAIEAIRKCGLSLSTVTPSLLSSRSDRLWFRLINDLLVLSLCFRWLSTWRNKESSLTCSARLKHLTI